ncbi:MAG: ATP-dependent helicase [Lachnospiraceae bacterium]|nr:ATP-dependent helicase [Lachnospiraceae bacterium]
MPFNEAQSQAVCHGKGPMMVLAGPGSGKTTVIVGRVRHLVEQQGVNPSNILVITFTRAAAREMEERYLACEQNSSGGRVSFGTFHSVFFRILKLAYQYGGENIVKEEQRIQFIRERMEKLSLDVEDEGEFIQSVLSEISAVKGEMMSLDHYYSKNCSEEIFKALYQAYEERLRQLGLLDFDDMLVMCYQLFQERKDILSAWQRKYQYILIDEFQDINRIQYEVMRMMALPENNLFVVGDDDQSIYRFRGAKPELMLGFPKDYPEAKQILLDVNYRSTPQIVNTAGRLIIHNKARFSKSIRANKKPGRPVVTRIWQDGAEEVEAICQEIRDYIRAGAAYEDIAVLFRTNQGPRLLVEKMMEYSIPFQIRDELPNIYDHWIARNLLDYILVARGHGERGRVLSIINRPKRYISRDALEGEMVNWEQVKSFYQDKGWMVERIEDLQYHLMSIRKMAPTAAINYIRKAVGYNDYLKEYAQFRRMKPEELLEVADQIQESAAEYKTCEAWFQHILEYKEQLAQQAKDRNRKKEGVSLMTMHSSKGLEFRIVYILDANEGVTPHHKAFLDADMEEERRMFYVAMTRAKERLHVYYVKERYHKKQEVSRFVKEYLEGEPSAGYGRGSGQGGRNGR